MVLTEKAGIQSLALNALNTHTLTFDSAKVYLDLCDPSALDANMKLFEKTMPDSGDVTYDTTNSEVDFKTINGGTASVGVANLSNETTVSATYNRVLLNKYMADLVRDEDNNALTAALNSTTAEIAKVRIALASHFAPVGSSINDYLQSYEQFPAGKEIRFKDAVGDVIAYKAATDALPTIPVGVYTPGTTGTTAKLVFSGVDLSAEPYTVATSTNLTTFKFAGASAASTVQLTVASGVSTFEAGANGAVTGASTAAGNMGLSFASSSSTEAVIDATGRTYGGVALTDLSGTYTAGITASTTPYADIVGTYTAGTGAVKAKLVIQGDLSVAPYNYATSTNLTTFKFAGASAVSNDVQLTVASGVSTFERTATGVVAGASASNGTMALTFEASSATKAVVNSTGVFLAAAKAKLVIPGDLSAAPYSYNTTASALTTFKFAGASAVTTCTLTVASGVSTFEAANVGAVTGATTSGAMTLSFEASSATKAVVDATGKFFTSNWVLSSATKMPELVDTKVPDTYFLGDNSLNGSVIQPAVGYTTALGAYIADEDPDAGKYRSEDIKINGTISAATANFLLRLSSGDGADVFNAATTTEEEVKTVRNGFVKEPTLTSLVASGVGDSISKNVIAGLDGFGAYAETIGFTNANFQAWDDAMVVAQNPNSEVYIYSASNQYRAKTQSHDNTQYAAAKVLAAEKALGSNGPTTVANVELYVGTSTVVVERADAITGWVEVSTIKASELYMRAENNYVPSTKLTSNTFTKDDIVDLAKSKGITLSIDGSGGTIKTLFTEMDEANETTLAENALESYNTGEESILSKVASYALSESLATTAGTTNITKLTGLIMGGASSQVNTGQFTFTDQGCLVAAAIDILDNVNGFAPLANEAVMKAIAKSGLLRKENNQNAFHPLAGIRFGAKSVSSTGNLNDFAVPSKGVSGATWANVGLDEQVNLVGKIYNNIIENSGLNFNAAEKAHLIDDLVEDFVGSSALSAEYLMQLDQYLDQDVKDELLKEKGSGLMRLSAAPLKLSAMITKVNDTTLTIADRKRCLGATRVLAFEFSELNASTTPGTALTAPASNTITSIASIAPKLDAATAKATLETLLEFGGLSQNDLEVFLQAFYDLGLLDNMEMNTLELSAFSPSDFTEALAGVMANEASNLTQYGASANATSNVNEMTASYSNRVRGIALNFMPAMNHPAFNRTVFISDINGTAAADLFNAQMVALDAFSGNERYISPDLAQALTLDGFDDAVLNNGRFLQDVKVGRVIKGSEPTTYID